MSSSSSSSSYTSSAAALDDTTGWDRLWKKCKEEPLVPLGAILTGSVLLGGLASFTRSKNPRSTQKWMRARVLAQGGTLAAMAGYVALHK